MVIENASEVRSDNEKRAEARYPISSRCMVRCDKVDQNFILAQIVDVSVKGVFLKPDQLWFSRALRHGDSIDLAMSSKTNMRGRIVHFHEGGLGISLHNNDLAIVCLMMDI